MVRRTFVGMTMVLAIGGATAGATAHRVSGVVTAATAKSLQIAGSKETTTVNVDDKTA